MWCLPSEEEDNEVPSDFPFFKTTEESRWETDDVINSPPDPIKGLSSVANCENNINENCHV
jgi:hypothetical protein